MARKTYSIAWSCHGRRQSHAFDDLFSCVWLFSFNVNDIRAWHDGRLVARSATYQGV